MLEIPSLAFDEPPFFPVDVAFVFILGDNVPVVQNRSDLSYSKNKNNT